jgi:hypothetical protein
MFNSTNTNSKISYSEYYKSRLQRHDELFKEIINTIPKKNSIYRKKRDYTEAFSQNQVFGFYK